LRRLFVSFLLFIFLFNICGYYVPFLLIRIAIRDKIAYQVKEENYSIKKLVKITFNTKNLSNHPVWTKDGKEFCYRNEMYDVVKTVSDRDSVSYYCIKDKDENNLVETFVALLLNSIGNDKQNLNDHSKELSKYNVAVKMDPDIAGIINIIYPAVIFTYKSQPKKIDCPPPEIA
jgi:hypothetical protein